jgi:hypothetical protein
MNRDVPMICHPESGFHPSPCLPGRAEMVSKFRVAVVYTSNSLRLQTDQNEIRS